MMTNLPLMDINTTQKRLVNSSRLSRTACEQTMSDSPMSRAMSTRPANSARQSSSSIWIPKIQILARSDEQLKRLPRSSTGMTHEHTIVHKPLVRIRPDYNYLWEPVQRDDIRHQYDNYVAPQRLIASRPDKPHRMTTMFETQDRHDHNRRRVQAMQQRQWNREHMQYTSFPYAQDKEREIYKSVLIRCLTSLVHVELVHFSCLFSFAFEFALIFHLVDRFGQH
jgi:hypothetical protein